MPDDTGGKWKAGEGSIPAEPARRKRPPWQHSKSNIDDPDAEKQLQSMLRSPRYRPAVEDADFLRGDALRGSRLEIEYLKPELTLSGLGISETIVVFGSTRIPEPAAARRELEVVREQLTAVKSPDKALFRQVEIAERIVDKSRYYEEARAFGRLVSNADWSGAGRRVVIMTGAGPGIMEAANRGAFDAESESIGLNISLPHEQYPNPYVTPELCFRLHYFAIRKLHLVKRARALIAFPGGYGTLDELFETLTLIQTQKIDPIPVVLVSESFWRGAVNFDFLIDEGVIAPEDAELFWYADTARDIWDSILRWYAAGGEPLLPSPGSAKT